MRVLRLSQKGAARIDAWMAGRPVGPGRPAGLFAGRLVEAGVAHPVPPPDVALPSCVVVIPVRDDPTGLAETLAALRATVAEVPVTVVDDGSTTAASVGTDDGRPALIRSSTPGGPGAARNRGWRSLAPGAGGDAAEVVVFVDAGCVPEGGWLRPLLTHFADPAVAAVAPRIASRPGPSTPPRLAAYEARHSPLDMGGAAGPVQPGAAVAYVPTAVLAVRRSALAAAGGFDQSLRFGEDVDLVWRLHQAGWRIRYEPAARATHPVRPSYRAWAAQRLQYGRSAAPLAARHGPAVAPLAVQPWSLAAWGLLATGHPLLAGGLAAGTAEVLGRRAAGDPVVAAVLRRLAATGHLRAGKSIAMAIRRAWLAPTLAAAALAWRWGTRRTRASLLITAAAVMAGPPLALADDLAYQAGVWHGAWSSRSVAALLPRW